MRWSLLIAAAIACSPTPKEQPTQASNVGEPPKQLPKQPGNGPKVVITTPAGDVSVDVEVVSTEGTIEKGLMYRQFMAPDAGMLFLLGVDKEWTFWMRNTLIPLDMIFVRKSMTIAGIVENAEPKTDTLRRVHENSLYVLEVNGGWTKAHGVVRDATVRFANLPPAGPGHQ
ncbi:MAG: DUF192 domain-containing protein [Kofleriaceae bacterium]